jgi:hypothetical protein
MRITRHGFYRCAACGSHVRLQESCPTCADPRDRTGRGGAIAASLVAFSAVASACGSNEPPSEPTADPDPVVQEPMMDEPAMDEPIDDPTAVDVYGIPPEEETQEQQPPAVPAYGIAPPTEP